MRRQNMDMAWEWNDVTLLPAHICMRWRYITVLRNMSLPIFSVLQYAVLPDGFTQKSLYRKHLCFTN